jgi:hypothetical protein
VTGEVDEGAGGSEQGRAGDAGKDGRLWRIISIPWLILFCSTKYQVNYWDKDHDTSVYFGVWTVRGNWVSYL